MQEGKSEAQNEALRGPIPLKERLTGLMTEYGPIAALVWFALFFFTFAVAYLALQAGFDLTKTTSSSAATSAVGLGGAYVLTQLSKPIRVGLTLILTPVAARFFRRKKSDPAQDEASS